MNASRPRRHKIQRFPKECLDERDGLGPGEEVPAGRPPVLGPLSAAAVSQPLDLVLDLFYGRWRSQTLHAGVALGVFEAIGAEPVAAAALAHQLGLDAAFAYRLLRAMASMGVLREHGERTFSLTDAGAILRADHPQSMRDALLLREGPEHTAIWKHLPAIVRDGGANGFLREYGTDAFSRATEDGTYGRAFDAGMSSQSNLQSAWTIEALCGCDLGDVGMLCDVGGGQGHLLGHLLLRHPHLRGIVLDRPSVLADRPSPWPARLGVGDRCSAVAGDMFVDVPSADAYVMKMILHDWNDDECVRIL